MLKHFGLAETGDVMSDLEVSKRSCEERESQSVVKLPLHDTPVLQSTIGRRLQFICSLQLGLSTADAIQRQMHHS